jgi:hypothetical protein
LVRYLPCGVRAGSPDAYHAVCEILLNTILSSEKITFAILGGGLGSGLGMIVAALKATGYSRANRPERLSNEALAILLGRFTGLALGWLTGRPATPACASGRTRQSHYH